MAKPFAIEVEIDCPRNEALYFTPLQRSVRGRFDMMRVAEPMARVASTDWPLPVPSQRLGIDADGKGYITEPLHDAEHTATREKIVKRGMSLEAPRVTFEGIDLPTWLFWIKRAVEDGIAKVVSGKLPEKIEGKPKLSFNINDPPESPLDRLAAAMDRQSAMFEKVLERLSR